MSMQVATINLVNSVEQEEFEAGLLSESYSVSSKKGKKFKLPTAFDSEVREDLIRQAGQLGYHQRTEFNKRILRISKPEDNEITPDGGFLHYGEVRNPYIIIQGSLPGPAKRLLRFRDAVRPRSGQSAVEITYVSTASKQGV